MAQHRVHFVSLKSFLFLAAGVFAVAAALLVILLSSAATVTGGTPFSAVTLAEGANTGVLAPGEQRWFKYNPDPNGNPVDLEKSLTLIFTPDDGSRRYKVLLQLFEEGELKNFFQGDAGKMNNFGAGQVVERDGNPQTGESFWHGWLSGQKTYYIQVVNGANIPIDYWLFAADIMSYDLGKKEAPKAWVKPEIGTDPTNPAPMLPQLNKGTLKPHTVAWYALTYVDFSNKDRFKDLSYSLFFTPDDGHRRHRVTFELFEMRETGKWQRGDAGQMTNFGAGMLVSRDGDYNTGERIWRGSIVKNITYLLAVENNTDTPIDYYLFDGDIINPELGPKTVAKPAQVFAEGASPQTATALKIGLNKGGLEPGQEAWYSFRLTDNDENSFEPMALTMITTPDDGNRIYHMNMDIFTAGGAQNWSPGDNSKINNVGAGGVVFRDDNPQTGEKFWNGWVVDNDLYLVQIRNLTDIHMDYWLYTGDVYGPELGEPTKPVVRQAAPGTAPFAAVPLEVGINQGQLKPGEERWYSFLRADFTNPTSGIDTVFTLIFTPDDGNRKYKVGFELFKTNEVGNWSPDNRFTINGFGQGSVVDRDRNPLTGELLWKGSVMSNNTYNMRVFNGSDVTIDYRIYPEDVINTTLK